MMNPGHVYAVFIAGKAGLSASIGQLMRLATKARDSPCAGPAMPLISWRSGIVHTARAALLGAGLLLPVSWT